MTITNRVNDELIKQIESATGVKPISVTNSTDVNYGTLTIKAPVPPGSEFSDKLAEFLSGQLKNARVNTYEIQFEHGIFMTTFLCTYSIPPADTQTIYPPEPTAPDKVDDDTLLLLRMLRDGHDVRVFWQYKVPTLTIDGEDADRATHAAYLSLWQHGTVRFFDGYRWMESGCRLSFFLTTKTIDNSEEGILSQVLLKDQGREWLDKYKGTFK